MSGVPVLSDYTQAVVHGVIVDKVAGDIHVSRASYIQPTSITYP
jgi:hypothetical protein